MAGDAPTQGAPILVTGAHRSGTTWVGTVLSRASRCHYIWEPFNVHSSRGICDIPVKYWYTLVDSTNSVDFAPGVRDMLNFRYSFAGAARTSLGPREIAKTIRDSASFSVARHIHRRPIIKDPLAVFSVPWLAECFGVHSVILVRHPAGLASSVKRLGWRHPFDHFLAQDNLMDSLSGSERRLIDAANKNRLSIVEEAAVIWRVVYYYVGSLGNSPGPVPLITKFEDLASDPQRALVKLSEEVGLTPTARMKSTIGDFTSDSNPTEARRGASHDLRRDSSSLGTAWTARLTNSEVRNVRRIVQDVSELWYSDDDWIAPQ